MKNAIKIIHWLPRIICILAILFISMFALDAFAPGQSFSKQLVDFFMHLSPSFILSALLVIAWKWEMIGGIIFALIGIVMSPVIFLHNYQVNHFSIGQCIGIILMITFPFIVVGVLFIISYYFKKKRLVKTPGFLMQDTTVDDTSM